MLLGGIRLYLKLEVWFVADCTMSPNASVIDASEYNLLCGLYNNFLFKWLTQKTKPKQKKMFVQLCLMAEKQDAYLWMLRYYHNSVLIHLILGPFSRKVELEKVF